jgi:hypothetical protein
MKNARGQSTGGPQARIASNSVANQTCTVRLCFNPGSGDEGRANNGTFAVSTDGAGNTDRAENNLVPVPNPPVAAGRFVTATRENGKTSDLLDGKPVGQTDEQVNA